MPTAVSPSRIATSPVQEEMLRLDDETLSFSLAELKQYADLSEKYYGVRPTQQEALMRCTMLVRFLQVVHGDEHAACDVSRSGHASIR